jgi:Protein of unknown function (DUF3071)
VTTTDASGRDRERPARAAAESAEIPIGQRLSRLIKELQEPRRPRPDGSVGRFRTEADEAPLVRLLPPERSLTAMVRSGAAWEEAPEPRNGAPSRIQGRRRKDASTSTAGASASPRWARSRKPEAVDAPRSKEIRPRTERPEIPQGSRLGAAEIQALIRAGRGVRSVAEKAEAPVDWVRYLAEPVMAERNAVVSRVLHARPRRARAKGPGEPLGRAVLLSLRARKVAAPEHVIANGFAAYRPAEGPWRVRLTFRQDGRRFSALWAYNPRTNEVEPRNRLADELGWRRDSRR